MKSNVVRDRRRRQTRQTQETRRRALKYLQRSQRVEGTQSSLCAVSPLEVTRRLARLPRDGSRTRARRFCLKTGRRRGVLRAWSRSRRVVKDLATSGVLAGIRPASW